MFDPNYLTMPNIEKIIALVLFSLINISLYSQGELIGEAKILYRNERSVGAFLSSNGMGANFRYGKRVNARNQILYQGEFTLVKNPKEIKSSNNYFNNQSFVFGKINNFFVLKGFYGRQHELYRKNDRGGISIRYNYNIGPSIGFLKPIYYEVLYFMQDGSYYSEIEKFTTLIHQSNILGRASFFKGINELNIVPGGSAKIGLIFEYSKEDIKINALEAGIGIDLFPKKIPILATNKNSNYFFNLTVGFWFGKAIDVSEGARTAKQTKEERRTSRKIMKEQKKDAKELENF